MSRCYCGRPQGIDELWRRICLGERTQNTSLLSKAEFTLTHCPLLKTSVYFSTHPPVTNSHISAILLNGTCPATHYIEKHSPCAHWPQLSSQLDSFLLPASAFSCLNLHLLLPFVLSARHLYFDCDNNPIHLNNQIANLVFFFKAKAVVIASAA